MLQLLVTVTVQPGRAADYIAAFEALAPKVLLEAGCLEYGIYMDSTDSRFDNPVRPDTVVLCEKWSSIETLQHHTRNSPALDEFRQQVKDIKIGSSFVLLTPATKA
jgi:quinol monooxygenase YgiN